MKIICETKKVINTETTCKKEYCCKKMEKALTVQKEDSNHYHPQITITEKNQLKLITHCHYDYGSQYMILKYCPWCATKIEIEDIKIDNPEIPVEPIVPKPATNVSGIKKGKKHWWSR